MRLVPIEGKANDNLYRHELTGIIYFWMSKAGRGRIQRSTKTKVLSEARKIADDLRAKFLTGKTTACPGQLMENLYSEWIATKEIKAPATVTRYEFAWAHLKLALKYTRPEQVTPYWWESTYIPMRRRESPGCKLFAERKTLKGMLLFAHRQGYIEKIPYLINPDPETKAGKVFTDDEIRALLANAGKTLQLQILMAFTMGMRKGEIINLKADRINITKLTIALRAEDTKTRTAREFAVSEAIWPHLAVLLNHESGYVFPSPYGQHKPISSSQHNNEWRQCRTSASVTGRFYDLRHTFLTRAFKTPGSNAALICWYAGTSLEVAQKTYLHFDVDDTRAIAGLVGI